MKHAAITLTLVATVILIGACQPQQNKQDKQDSPPDRQADIYHRPAHETQETPQNLMRAKLAHAQAVLEGIALEDFDQILNNARRLTLLSQEADAQVRRTIDYTVFSSEFRRVTEDLAKNAARKNLHAATLDYMQMTMTCVKCHSYMRNEGVAMGQPPLPTLATRQVD